MPLLSGTPAAICYPCCYLLPPLLSATTPAICYLAPNLLPTLSMCSGTSYFSFYRTATNYHFRPILALHMCNRHQQPGALCLQQHRSHMAHCTTLNQSKCRQHLLLLLPSNSIPLTTVHPQDNHHIVPALFLALTTSNTEPPACWCFRQLLHCC